jgi:hypothetical protein
MPVAGPNGDAVQVWTLRASEQTVERLMFAASGIDSADVGSDCNVVRVSARNANNAIVTLHVISIPADQVATWDAAAVQASGVELLVPPYGQTVEVFEVAPGDTVLAHASAPCAVSIYKLKGDA